MLDLRQGTKPALAQQKVTTIVCMCDPIAPVFLTQGLSSQRYFPEHVLPGFLSTFCWCPLLLWLCWAHNRPLPSGFRNLRMTM